MEKEIGATQDNRLDRETWTLEDLEQHIRCNTENTYSMGIVLAALYKKLYGKFPKMGLSGYQADCANIVVEKLAMLAASREGK